jgi:hypothetical protein
VCEMRSRTLIHSLSHYDFHICHSPTRPHAPMLTAFPLFLLFLPPFRMFRHPRVGALLRWLTTFGLSMMMSLRFCRLLTVFLFFVYPSHSQSTTYEVKSGIITFDVVMDLGGSKVTNRSIVYFDEFGAKECRETYKGGKLSESYVSDGTSLFTLLHDRREAIDQGPALRGTEARCSWDEVSDTDKREGKARRLEPMTVAGTTCDAFVVKTANGDVTYAGWKNILFFMNLDGKSLRITRKAVKFEENAAVPASKFSVPSGFSRKPAPM